MLSFKQFRLSLLEVFSNKQKEQLITKFGNDSEKYIDQFDELRTKNRKEVKGIDITKFKSLDELKYFLNNIGISKTEQIKKIKDEGVDLVFENDDVYVYHIKTKDASCKYGSGTKWCITQKDGSYWEQYTNKDVTFYFIIKKNPIGDDYDKLAISVYPKSLTDNKYEEIVNSGDDYHINSDNILQMWDMKDENISNDFVSELRELNIPSNIFKEIEDTTPFVMVGDRKFKYTMEAGIRVYGDINIYNMKLEKIPDFGDNYRVTGNFNCSYNQLTSLEGSPSSVGGDFNCYNNQLTTLNGSPKTVDGNFNCSNNQLTSLKGGPSSVGGYFYCSDNNLTSLEGAPNSVGDDFNCYNNQLTTLNGSPKTVDGDFNCSNNQLTSLKGGPSSVGGYFNCYKQKNKKKFTKEEVREVSDVKGNIYV